MQGDRLEECINTYGWSVVWRRSNGNDNEWSLITMRIDPTSILISTNLCIHLTIHRFNRTSMSQSWGSSAALIIATASSSLAILLDRSLWYTTSLNLLFLEVFCSRASSGGQASLIDCRNDEMSPSCGNQCPRYSRKRISAASPSSSSLTTSSSLYNYHNHHHHYHH